MKRSEGENRAVLSLIFAPSLASLSYELALMRIFSISLWYHFAFMVISIAMLGIAASGTLLSVLPVLKDIRRVPLYALLLAAGIPASYLLANVVPFDPARLSWDRTQLFFISLYYFILCAPFFFFGLIVSTTYAELSREANAVYASDLTGAGAGALAVFWLLSLGGPEKTVFIVSSLLATALLAFGNRKVRICAMLLLVSNMTLLFIHSSFIQPRVSPYKPFELAMKFPGAERLGTFYSPYSRVDLFKSPAVRFAPGLSFRYLDPLPEQTGLAIDAGEVHAITDARDEKKLGFLRYLPSSLVYRLGKAEEVLVIEPRGGLSVLLAKEFKAGTIYAVDSNPLVLDARAVSATLAPGRRQTCGSRRSHRSVVDALSVFHRDRTASLSLDFDGRALSTGGRVQRPVDFSLHRFRGTERPVRYGARGRPSRRRPPDHVESGRGSGRRLPIVLVGTGRLRKHAG